jgi:hypothetical protein
MRHEATHLTIAKAAAAGYKSRSQINKDVKNGNLTTVPHPHKTVFTSVADPTNPGKKRKVEKPVLTIPIADLIRRYGEAGGGKAEPIATQADLDQAQEVEDLKAQLLRAEAVLEESRRAIADKDKSAAEEREKFMELVENSQKQLQDMREDRERTEKRDQEIIEELRKPWLKRLFGR